MTILTIIIVFVSILLDCVVLLQKSKGGGLAAGFQSYNQLGGAPKTADFLEKATWTLMGVIAVLSICCTLILKHSSVSVNEADIDIIEQTASPVMPEPVADDVPAAEAPAADAE